MSDATCKTCPYGKAYASTTETDGTTLTNLECRRHCPVVAQEITMAQSYVNPCIGIWPDVQPYDWCGEHPDLNRGRP